MNLRRRKIEDVPVIIITEISNCLVNISGEYPYGDAGHR